MKLLIDIPYEAYYTFKCDLGKGNLNALAEIVANGKPYEPIGDLISRGDALKAVDKRHEELLHDTEYLKKHCQIDLLGIKKHILEIPPVDAIVNEIEVRPQGECCGSCYLCDVGDCGADMRGGRKCDCISREALKDIAYINKGNFNTVEGIREWIDNAQTVPQVTVFTETADETAVADLKAELQSVIETRPKGGAE